MYDSETRSHHVNKSFIINGLCPNSKVVKHLTPKPKIKSSNPASDRELGNGEKNVNSHYSTHKDV
jgi:hypothetical protein